MAEKNKAKALELQNAENADEIVEMDLDNLENVTGGAFEEIPRVPVNPIDDNLKGKI